MEKLVSLAVWHGQVDSWTQGARGWPGEAPPTRRGKNRAAAWRAMKRGRDVMRRAAWAIAMLVQIVSVEAALAQASAAEPATAPPATWFVYTVIIVIFV